MTKPFAHLHLESRIIHVADLVFNSGNPYQYSGHGTAVLSTMAAQHGAFNGTAYKSDYFLYVTEDVQSEYRIEEYNWAIAAEHADSSGVDIIHSSVGYNTFNDGGMNYTYNDLDGKTAIVTRAADLAFSKGMFVVTSAGNEGNNSNWPYVTMPADAKNILSVGSVTSTYSKSSFSSVGPTVDGRVKPDVVALGSETAIVNSSGDLTFGNGTSYSAPLVAGLAAGVWQANPDWSNFELLNAIKGTASRSLDPDTTFGYGIPNYNDAVIGRLLSISDIISDKIKVYPNPFRDNKIYIDITDNKDVLPLSILVYDTQGSVLVD
ncbi:MAG: S8 family serine peptidase, partial [Pirellulales bacterium]|nr:S8 family serine peptidase [Pirellulales bacterium]